MPLRIRSLKEQILRFDNFQEAFLRASRGKNAERKVVLFREDLNDNLHQIISELDNGTFRFGNYHFFTIYDPKKRVICAADFTERVVFHAIMRICHPYFERHQVYDSYASRIGKGTYAALDRARHFAGKYMYFAKLDIKKYFDSIHHEILFKMLRKMFQDVFLLKCFRSIIDSYNASPGKGVPIGNLTSQYFANHYLTFADRFLLENQKAHAIVRYMDDTLVFSNDKEQLLSIVRAYENFVNETLDLQMHTPVINRTCYGAPFLGYVVYGDRLRLNQRSRHRYRVKSAALHEAYAQSLIPERDYLMRLQALDAFLEKADAYNFRRSLDV